MTSTDAPSAWDGQASDVVEAADGTRPHVRHGGEGSPILLHGVPQGGRQWARMVPSLLAAGYRGVVPDLRAFGLSDRPVEGYDVGATADDVRAAAGRLGLDGSCMACSGAFQQHPCIVHVASGSDPGDPGRVEGAGRSRIGVARPLARGRP